MKTKHKDELDEFIDDSDEVTLTIGSDEVDVLHRILTQLVKGRVKTFDSTCKFCNKTIRMYSNDNGTTWKPTSIKNGEKHKCKQGMKFYKKKFNNK